MSLKPTVAQTLDEFGGHPVKFAQNQWRAWMLGNYDGDTITVRYDRGFFETGTRNLRVYGINAPELHTGTNQVAGAQCRDYLASIVPVGSALNLLTSLDPSVENPVEKFSRILAQVTVYKADGSTFDLATSMLAFGHGVVTYIPK